MAEDHFTYQLIFDNVGLDGGDVFRTASGHPLGWVNAELPALLVPETSVDVGDSLGKPVFD